MKTADISSALKAQLLTVAVLDESKVQWENLPFTPPDAEAWFRATLLPARSESAGIGVDAPDREIGIFQIDVFTPAGEGEGNARDLVDAIEAAFPRGSSCTYNGTTVTIESRWAEVSIQEPDWFHIPVNIAWRADTAV